MSSNGADVGTTFTPIKLLEDTTNTTANDIGKWTSNYKEAFVEQLQDLSELTLIHPDDCLLVAGPPRLSQASGTDVFFLLGFCSTFQYSNPRQVTPVKALGSRRNFFAATGGPVSGSMQRLLFIGRNFLSALYANAKIPSTITDGNRHSKYIEGESSGNGAWWTNMEEDVFRIPFGLGIIYNSPSSLAGAESYDMAGGAEYIECCTLASHSVSLQAGQPSVSEQVDFQGDRVLPWSIRKVISTSNIKAPVSNTMGS